MLVTLIIFFAVFVQSSVGFGFALVSMPLLVELLGIQIAAPLVAVVAFTSEIFVLLRYRHALQIRTVVRLVIAALVGIPLGILLLRQVDPIIVTRALGVILVAYALYALFSPRLPLLANQLWAYGFGFVAGILGGAYNTSGPPVIIYGNCRRWPPNEFKSNLQGFFVFSSITVVLTHALSGNYTAVVGQNYLYAIPGMVLGLLAGFSLDGRINPDLFRKIVLVILVVLGIRLIIG
ncbi:MAG: sulfite exporter TauE/SafE family protein [Anaerolineales bacterium]|nr:sulfite exporter TauE/SafE family protein [Anaerolineales bacterium]